jgi:hypothetical protein
MATSGKLRHVAFVRNDVSEECSASIIRVTTIGELGTLAVSSNRHTRRRNTKFTNSCHPEDGGAIPPKRRFLQEPHGVTSKKTPFFTKDMIYVADKFSMKGTGCNAVVTMCSSSQLIINM